MTQWKSGMLTHAQEKKGGYKLMRKKWLYKLGASLLALSLVTACGMTNDNNDNDTPEAPLNQDEDQNNDLDNDDNRDDDNLNDDLNEDDRNDMDDNDRNNNGDNMNDNNKDKDRQ